MSNRTKHHGTAVSDKPKADKPKSAVATAIVAAFTAGTESVAQWFQLHGFADKNIRAENGSSFGNPIADLFEQVRPLGDTKNGEGVTRAETDEDRKRIGNSLVGLLLNGWDQDERHAIVVTIATAAEQAKAVAERKAMLAAWRTSGQEDATYLALVPFVEQYWFPKGEAAPPALIVHNCHRRTFAMPAAVFARAQRGIGTIGDYSIPVAIRQPMGSLAEIDERLKENLGHDLGRSAMVPLDYLRIAKMISDAGGTESMLRKYGKVGEAQTAFRFYTLHTRFPHCKLYERAMLPKGQPTVKGGKQYSYVKGESWLPYSTSMKEALGALLSDRDFKQSGTPMNNRDKVPCDSEQVESFAEYFTLGATVKSTWSQKETDRLQRATDYNVLFNLLGVAIGKNDFGTIDMLQKRIGKEVDALLKDNGITYDAVVNKKLS